MPGLCSSSFRSRGFPGHRRFEQRQAGRKDSPSAPDANSVSGRDWPKGSRRAGPGPPFARRKQGPRIHPVDRCVRAARQRENHPPSMRSKQQKEIVIARPRFGPRDRPRNFGPRVNDRIRVPEIRVIGADGQHVGCHEYRRGPPGWPGVSTLDLVEVNPKASPPVCKIMDFGKLQVRRKEEAGRGAQAADANRAQGDQASSEDRRSRSSISRPSMFVASSKRATR